jgi:nucleotide-binding universal stress UspA family protein
MTTSSGDRTGFSFSTLLIPVDLTPVSDRVLGRVALLPLSPKARLTLLHVVPGSLPVRARPRAERDAKKAVAEEARNLARSLSGGITIVPLVTVGTVASEVAAHAADTNAEMVVMGRVGGRAVRDNFLGSTRALLATSRTGIPSTRAPADA